MAEFRCPKNWLCVTIELIKNKIKMKTKNILFAIIMMFIATISRSQTWDLGGNTTIVPGTDKLGTTDATPIPFFTSDNERMRLTPVGWLGLNTPTPNCLYEVLDGSVMFRNSLAALDLETNWPLPPIGSVPFSGGGIRLMWLDSIGAFRAGMTGVEATIGTDLWWDAPNIGLGSVAMGIDVGAFNTGSVAIGSYSKVEGHSSVSVGLNNVVLDDFSYAFGRGNDVTNEIAVALGVGNNVSGLTGMACGNNNEIDGELAFGFGWSNQVHGFKNYAAGLGNETEQVCASAFGVNLHTDANFAMTLGAGSFGAGVGALYNNIDNSLMIGMNSNVPTIFVANSGGTAGSFGNVGFGNITAPTELIDANGNARFRQIPDETPNVLITGVEEDAEGDYSLSYLEFSADGDEYLGGDGAWHEVPVVTCDWNIVGTGNNLAMGYSGACVPKNVGIGTSSPDSKLTVLNTLEGSGQTVYIRSGASGANAHDGMNLSASGGTLGVRGISSEASASANTSSSNVLLIGVRGRATSQPGGTDFTGYTGVYGIYGSTGGAASGTNYYAGYFAGDVFSTSGNYLGSDAMLKSNIEELQSSLEKIMVLEPKSYQYNQEAFPQMNLPSGTHSGFIAGEIQEVFPELVKGATQPEELDEEGNVLQEAISFNGVNYVGLIPHLVGAIKEQQAQIEALTALVNQCCAAGGDKSLQGSGSAGAPTEYGDFDLQIEKAYLGQNVPNPFQNETSITYRIPAQAQVRVRILGQSGQQIDTLVDGMMPKGEYRIVWNASHLPAGMYYYTLEADGVELVKKAVKL